MQKVKDKRVLAILITVMLWNVSTAQAEQLYASWYSVSSLKVERIK